MFKWSAFPFIRFSLFLILGVLLQNHFPQILDFEAYVIVFGILFLITHALSHYHGFYQYRIGNGILIGGIVIWFGSWVSMLHDQSTYQNHYTQHGSITAFQGKVVSEILEKEKYFRFELSVSEVLTEDIEHTSSGIVHVYLKKPIAEEPGYGDQLMISADLLRIPPPMNPHEFDYRRYMRRKNIYSQAFVNPGEYLISEKYDGYSLIAFSLGLRESVRQQLSSYFSDIKERQIALALIVGIKDYLDPEIKKAYSTAGATHVLAVSGLHVGILYLFLIFLLKPLKESRTGKYIFAGISLLVIWIYAFVTGLSPSVFRAAFMFSILVLADVSGRRRNIYNSLGLAAFILILINPNYVYEVGFQLSFLAVLGIVYLFPRIYSWLHFNNWLGDKIWSITCVSIAAQISTAPLSLYYFNQFPTYFLFSNLVVIPAAFAILLAGIPMVILGSVWAALGELIGVIMEKFIWLLNFLIQQIESLPFSKLQWLYLSRIEILALYGFLLFFLWSIQYRRFINLLVAGCFCLFILLSVSLRGLEATNRKELLMYELKGQSAFDVFDRGTATLILDEEPEDLSLLKFQIDPHRLRSGFSSIENSWMIGDELFNCNSSFCLWEFDGMRVMRLKESLSNYSANTDIETDVLVIANNSLSGTDQLEFFKYKYLVFDSTNDFWYLRRIRQRLMAKGIKAHIIPFDGYWSLTLPKRPVEQIAEST